MAKTRIFHVSQLRRPISLQRDFNWRPDFLNMKKILLIAVLGLAAITQAKDLARDKKQFSIFTVVQFDNRQCQADQANTMGTCFSAEECGEKGGTVSGNCAAGFGVCCVITVNQEDCGSDINHNCTYIQNTAYPSGFTTASKNCAFNFKTASNICQIRLDFDDVVLTQPSTTATSVGKCDGDNIAFTSASGTSLTSLCGTLTGTHMYIETARESTGGTITVSTGTDTTTSRRWKIKVNYIECETPWKAPTDCLQYLTGTSGSFKSFNQANRMIRNQQYDVCIRKEKGYCAFQVSENTNTPNSFLLDGQTGVTTSRVGTNCQQQYIQIQSDSSTASTRFCGTFLSVNDADTVSGVVRGFGSAFRVGVVSGDNDPTQTTAILANSGFDLSYTQVPCNF